MAKLVINPTSGARKEIPVGDKVLSIGRDPSNDLVLSDAMVSRRHAILELREGQYYIRDNNSSNGTLVNGERVVSDQALRDGDLIAIGSARLLFHVEPAGAEGGVAEALPKPLGEPVETGSPASRCASCGLPAGPADRFCRGCGKELTRGSQRQVVCGRCSSPVALPAEYCGNCGEPLLARANRHQVPTRPRPWAPPPIPGPESKAKGPPAAATPGPPPARAGKPRRPAGVPSRRPLPVKEAPAGFWIRCAAYLIDGVIIALPMLIAMGLMVPTLMQSAGELGTEPSPLVFVLPLAGGALSFLLFVLYPVYFWSTRGATPGKSLLGLKVVDSTGQSPIGVRQALVRLAGYLINGFTFGVGFLLIAFTEDKRGLHDRLAETAVVRRR